MNFRKMYLVNESEFDSFKADRKAKENKTDLQMKEYNQSFIENKIGNEAEVASEWGKLGKQLVPILKEGNQPDEDNSPETFFENLKGKISSGLMNKAVKLYTFLSKLPEVKIGAKSIYVDNQKLVGNAIDIIDDLIRTKKDLTFDSVPLIKVASQNPEFEKLIFNKGAKTLIKNWQAAAIEPTIEPNLQPSLVPSRAEPRSLPVARGRSRSRRRAVAAETDDDDEFYSDEESMNESASSIPLHLQLLKRTPKRDSPQKGQGYKKLDPKKISKKKNNVSKQKFRWETLFK